ncbi:hypothetical protein GCM10022246_32220 [Pedobacter ginsengiterrae]|uniref:DUF4142 domain-containing protein n=2 Tax=Pedobacter ginsengiterrae TaxID=871696 RepID=A0ABP7Q789_9SPHI
MACNSADKRSSMEKDSISGDTVMPNKVGGSETFQTKLDGEAADHLRNITYSLLMEDRLLKLQAGNAKNKPSETLTQLMDINRASLKRMEAYATGKSVILPSDLLSNQQITLDSVKSLATANGDKARSTLLKANGSALLKELEQSANNRDQDFKKFMNEEYANQQKKNNLLQSL